MPDENIKISVITVCLNSEKFIEKTIKSVINQSYSNIEYIIIDGKSTDNTLNIIKKYIPQIDIIVSERDKGIYDAMNKGIDLANGDLIYFLNTGDYLYENETLSKLLRVYNNTDCQIIYGDIIYYDKDWSKYISGPKNNVVEIISRGGINHQSILAQKNLFKKCGYFDTDYKIFSDFDWLLRCLIKSKIKIRKVEIPFAYYLSGGLSDKYNEKYLYERYEIITKYASLNHLIKYAHLHPINFIYFLKYRFGNTF